jgi:hypothetical protein
MMAVRARSPACPAKDCITDATSGIRAPPPISTVASGMRPDRPMTSPANRTDFSIGGAIMVSGVSCGSSSRPPSLGMHTAPVVDSISLA